MNKEKANILMAVLLGTGSLSFAGVIQHLKSTITAQDLTDAGVGSSGTIWLDIFTLLFIGMGVLLIFYAVKIRQGAKAN